jgi:hypothetical protein
MMTIDKLYDEIGKAPSHVYLETPLGLLPVTVGDLEVLLRPGYWSNEEPPAAMNIPDGYVLDRLTEVEISTFQACEYGRILRNRAPDRPASSEPETVVTKTQTGGMWTQRVREARQVYREAGPKLSDAITEVTMDCPSKCLADLDRIDAILRSTTSSYEDVGLWPRPEYTSEHVDSSTSVTVESIDLLEFTRDCFQEVRDMLTECQGRVTEIIEGSDGGSRTYRAWGDCDERLEAVVEDLEGAINEYGKECARYDDIG